MTTFTIATIDELWIRGALAERRLMHGRADQHGDEIVATDARDDELVEACERGMVDLRAAMPGDTERVRLVASVTPSVSEGPGGVGGATRPPRPLAHARGDSVSMTVEINGISIVTTPEFVADDTRLLRAVAGPSPRAAGRGWREAPGEGRSVPHSPLVWRNGSAAVLLHEAIGHPLELNMPPVEWPSWLRVDCPMEMRRASFSDVPLRRMTRVVVAQENAPFELPERRIDVQLVRGGAYDPLTDVVTIDVAVPRFTIRATRAQIAASIAGAAGEPIRYPGVVCSREGQELVVGSFAPLLVTRELP